jgi:hypothetical protein
MISQFSTLELQEELQRRETIETTSIKLFYTSQTDPYLLIFSDDNKLKFQVRDEYTYLISPASTIGIAYLIRLRDLCNALINK